MLKIKLIAIRICSPQKVKKNQAYLHQIYQNVMLQCFFRKLNKINLNYAIMSRKFGICLEGPNNQWYPDEEMLDDKKLLQLLKKQSKKYKNVIFLYWNHRPLTHNKWILMLKTAGFNVKTVRTTDDYKKFI